MAISDQTTNLTNLALSGSLTVDGVLTASNQSSTGTVTGTIGVFSDVSSTNTVRGALLFASDISSVNTIRAAIVRAALSFEIIGNTAITGLRKGTISVVATTVTANGSTVTQATVSPLATSDILLISPQSSLSSGVVAHAYVSAGSTVQFVYSNMSTANQNQIATVFNYLAVRS